MHKKEDGEKVEINISTLLSARGCPEKIRYASLGIIHSSDRTEFHKGLMQLYSNYLGNSELPEMVSDYIIKHSQREWYTIDAQYFALCEEEAAYHKRLASFFLYLRCKSSIRKPELVCACINSV